MAPNGEYSIQPTWRIRKPSGHGAMSTIRAFEVLELALARLVYQA